MDRYKVLKNFIREDICRDMSARIWHSMKNGYGSTDIQCGSSQSFYGLFNDIQALSLKKLELEVGEELIPTYNYCRFYRKNETLEKHIDREACEISFSVTLDFPVSPWLFWLTDNGDKSVLLNKGDAIIYKGCEVVHWRNAMVHQEWQTQAFFHYVRKTGPFANHAYDKENNKRVTL